MEKKIILNSNQQVSKWTVTNVKTEVIFGSPQNRCKGVGICKVMTLSAIQEAKRPVAYVSVSKTGKVKFDFLKEKISTELRKMHFKDDLFVVVDRFQFSDVMLKKLRREELHISAGIYEVKVTDQFLSVIF